MLGYRILICKLTQSQFENIVKEIDENGKGKIDFAEFFLVALFSKCDIDKNGYISYDEAKYVSGKYDKILVENKIIEENSVDTAILAMSERSYFETLGSFHLTFVLQGAELELSPSNVVKADSSGSAPCNPC